MTKEDKQKKLKELKDKLEKDFGKGTIIVGKEGFTEKIDSISTGSIDLDEKLGIGGVPRGRIVEIFGPESSGKSTLCLEIIAQCQKEGGIAAYIDLEMAYDHVYAEAIGVRTDDLHISQPNSGDEALEIMFQMLESHCYDVVILDSVAALLPAQEAEDVIGAQKMGSTAKLMAQALRKIVPAAYKSNTAVIMVNQIRDSLGISYGPNITTPAGKSLKFAASVRMQTSSSAVKDAAGNVMHLRAKVKIIKSKIARPFVTAEYNIIFGVGIDKMGEVLDKAIEHGIVQKGGSWLTYNDTKVQGMEKFKQLMLDNEDFVTELKSKLHGE